MAKKKEKMRKGTKKDERQREMESAPGYGDKKLEGPDRPST